MAEARFLAAADLHLGRPIASLPEALRPEARALGPFGALERLVELARHERVDAVLLAGDVVDDDGAYFEVFEALQQTIRGLGNIPLIAIAGNHDAKILPRLAKGMEGLTLLGEGGSWQTVEVQTPLGGVEVLGWSFPDTHCRASPFDRPPPPRKNRRLGLLHGDLDTSASVYAPCTSGQLRAHAADAWLLGHVHVPSIGGSAGASPAGYLGSVCGLDPSESGPRGAWLVRIDAAGASLESRAIAPIAWVRVDAPAEALTAHGLDATLHRLASDASVDYEHAQAVGVRMALVGEHEHWQEIARAADGLELGQPWTHLGRRVFLESVECRLSAPLPLERLAQERSVVGRIAGLVLELQSGGQEGLVREAENRFEEIGRDRNLCVPSLGERCWPLPDARASLAREARAVLSELLAQSGPGVG